MKAIHHKQHPSSGSDLRLVQRWPVWNGWTNAYNKRGHDGFITHAWEEKPRAETRALCGVKIQDSGAIKLGEDKWEPSCLRCKRILEKRGLLPLERCQRQPIGQQRLEK